MKEQEQSIEGRPTPLEIIINMRKKSFREEVILEEVEKELRRIAASNTKVEGIVGFVKASERLPQVSDDTLLVLKVSGQPQKQFGYFDKDAMFVIENLVGEKYAPFRIHWLDETPLSTKVGLQWRKNLTDLRNRLYENIPTGKIESFNLIKLINTHLKDLDKFIDESSTANEGEKEHE